MALHTLKQLIIASGNAGTSGQSFRNHVTGAASGAKMSDYVLTGWRTFTSSPAAQGPPMPAFDSGQVFVLSSDLVGGSRISYILPNGTGRLSTVKGSMPNGADVIVQSATINATPGVNASVNANMQVQLISGYNSGSVPGMAGSAHTSNGASDITPNQGDGPVYMHFSASIIGGNGISDGGYDDLNFTVSYNPNANGSTFNDVLSQVFMARMTHRGYNPNDFTVEWHQNSSYTSYLSGATDLMLYEGTYAPSGPPNPFTLWLRYQYPGGGGTWVNYGAVSCYDGRISY